MLIRKWRFVFKLNGIVLVSQRVDVIEGYGERRDGLDQNWTNFLMECGYATLPCPNNINVAKELLKNIDISGIILSGGNDLIKYGGDAPERDELERYLIGYSINKKIPLIGVCRGMQMIMDNFGVELIEVNNHVKEHHRLSYKDENIYVNSFHRYGAVKTNENIIVDCISSDGVFEKIRHKTYNIHGIMWHPERHTIKRNIEVNRDIEIFKEILK